MSQDYSYSQPSSSDLADKYSEDTADRELEALICMDEAESRQYPPQPEVVHGFPKECYCGAQPILSNCYNRSHFAEKKAGLKPKQIIERVRLDHGVHIQYKKAWRAKEAAQILVRGTPEDSYHNIAKWLFMAKERNPGSVVYLEMDSGTKFKYVFIAFGPSIRGFDLLRRVIAVDGTFLKGKFKGTLLVATAQDGDHHLYPIGFAIVDSENDKSWNWFFRCLRTIIPDAPDLVFVSDRASSIAKALTELYPASHHRICKYHLGNNIKVSFKGQSYLPLVESAAIAYTREEFAKIFIQIQDANPKLA
ncbi:PREDICTED: uncharacterized protein LOC104774022, partial [Camelina sativa]|uniref:Uncharacterized protein LOC104774022 n=1 Tax=Camelina sativa TaxID=90675 RepID=A0ABM0Y819_CAMSA